MKKDEFGKPICGESASKLGVRLSGARKDIQIDKDGMVHPMTGGLSVTPDDPSSLPPEFIPYSKDGISKNPVFRLSESELVSNISFRRDPSKPNIHGFVEPSDVMAATTYQEEIYQTAYSWEIHWE
ncbi:MAG: hypothetical protein AB7I41_01120 [Candidatus Sericytochromatia bacterium]